jgi:hypothetical protein
MENSHCFFRGKEETRRLIAKTKHTDIVTIKPVGRGLMTAISSRANVMTSQIILTTSCFFMTPV